MDILEIRRKAKARKALEQESAADRVEAPPVHAAPVEPTPVEPAPIQTASAAAARAQVTPAPAPVDLEEEPAADLGLLEEFFAADHETAIDRFADPAFMPSVQSIARVDPERTRFLAFRVGTEEYGIDLRYTREIMKPQPLTPVPRAPEEILGVISMRGAVLPVLDLGARLGCVGVGPRRTERYIYVDYQGEGLCVRVDEVSNVVGFTTSEIEPSPTGFRTVEEDFVLGIGRLDERMIILLNIDEVIGGLMRRGG